VGFGVLPQDPVVDVDVVQVQPHQAEEQVGAAGVVQREGSLLKQVPGVPEHPRRIVRQTHVGAVGDPGR